LPDSGADFPADSLTWLVEELFDEPAHDHVHAVPELVVRAVYLAGEASVFASSSAR
jgi:hypothetical protein